MSGKALLIERLLLLCLVGYVHSLGVEYAKTVVYYVERSLLLRHDEHTLVLAYSIGDDVNYGLRFTGSGRAVNNHISGAINLLYDLRLRIVEHLDYVAVVGVRLLTFLYFLGLFDLALIGKS